MAVLKSQMAADKKSIDAVSDENRKLTNIIEELKVKIHSLQAEVLISTRMRYTCMYEIRIRA